MIALTHQRFVVTSQFTIQACFGKITDGEQHCPAIQRRFEEVYFPAAYPNWNPANPPPRENGGPTMDNQSDQALLEAVQDLA